MGTYSVRWSPGKDTVVGHQSVATPQGDAHVTALTGWDAASRSVVTQYFANNGDHLTIRWPTIEEKMWKGRISGTYRGEPIEGPAQIIWGDSRIE